MADPLRRTLLAKLRGKKSKKGTTAGGCGVAANGGREGKEKLLQKTDGPTHKIVTITELDFLPDKMIGNEKYLNGSYNNTVVGLVENTVVVRNAFPQCEATPHINTGARDTQFSGGPRLGGRNNEKLLGVSVQREILDRGNDREEMSRFHKQEAHFSGQVQNGAFRGPQAQKKHTVPLPRQTIGGDSIGFGSCETTIFNFSQINTDRVKLADGHYASSKNGETNVHCDRDLKILCDGVVFGQQNSFRAGCVTNSIHKAHSTSHFNKEFATNVTTTGRTEMFPHESNYLHYVQSNAEEVRVIQNVESYEGLTGLTGDIKTPNLLSPTFFPTELEIFDLNVAPSVGCARDPLRHHSLDSEDDDYYDNEILPFYVSNSQNRHINVETNTELETLTQLEDPNVSSAYQNSSAQETDRLRSQLKEAYYLLINAMQDISLDGEVEDNGFIERGSTTSQSHDSVCSQSSTKHSNSDGSSSGKHSAQQVSDTDSLLNFSENISLSPKSSLLSKSCQNVSTSKTRAVLQRSVSDGAMKYATVNRPCAQLDLQSSIAVGNVDKTEKGSDTLSSGKTVTYDTTSSGEDGRLNESNGSVNSLSGSSDNVDNQGRSKHDVLNSSRGGGSAKPHGLTVNKMQEWMHRGRLLSSEMKQRIAGSSLRAHGPSNMWPAHGAPSGTKAATQTARVQRGKSAAPCQGVHQSALIENAHREASSALRAQLNTITVSKKRNWLQQSSAGPCPAEELGPGSEEYHPAQQHHHHHHQQHLISSPPPASGISPEGQPRPAPFPRPALRLPLPLVTITHGHSHARVSPQPPRQNAVDAAEEENDADDEGEIWYNPIPEDDEPEPPKPLPLTSRGATTVVSSRHQGPVSVAPEASQHPYPLRRPSGEAAGDGVAGPSSLLSVETAHTLHPNAAHSSEPLLQLHRQIFTCKPQEESLSPRPAAAADMDMSNAGFSAPSSPNPAKKGSSLNWSFPDRIKSPRTVRKLSMKMKKLPELSRKLSVKGTSSSSNNNASSQSESRAHSPKTNGGTESGQVPSRVSPGVGQSGGVFTSGNVISRYHLDSSVSTQPSKKKSSGGSKSASKGGYLSDGDSPELVAKSGKHGSGTDGKNGKAKEREANGNGSGGGSSGGGVGGGGGGVVGGGVSPKLHGSELDIDAFRPYSFAEQPKCATYLSGLMSVHFYGAEDLKPPRVDSRDVYCAIQVDSVNKARTALLTCRTAFLDMDHTFNIELENAQHLKLVVFSWEATPRRHRVCCHGTVALPALFRVTRTHQLAVRLEPRGMIYVKLGLIEQWQNSLDGVGGGVGADGEREPQVFGMEAWRVVEREAAGLMVPLLIHKCITEIERRGCQVVGLYRLCGSAAVKKELREAFERDSYSVELSESAYPDVNVITGVLKDYLRELPYPLITKQLYEAVLDSMARRPLRIGAGGCENDQADTEHTVGLLDILPEVEKVTLRKLLDHLKLVASHHEVNKMTCQNLAVCFGPVLLSQRQDASCHSNRVFIDSEELASALHFKKHIEVLHYLLQLWPVVDPYGKTSSPVSESPALAVAPVMATAPLRRRKERPQVLNLSEAEMAGVLRPKAGRLDSPSNRYAGDWSCCQETYFRPKEEADYDDVPSEESERPPEDKGDVTGDQRRPSEQEEAEKHGALTEVVEMDRPVEVEAETQREGDLEEEEEEEEEEVDEEEEEEEDEMEEADDEEGSRDLSGSPLGEPRSCEHILLPRQEEGQEGDDLQHEHEVKEEEHLAKEHTYQAYMKIQDISPVLSNRVNLKDLQESIDILIGNLERELNKNKLNVGY
ncbi:hypothetical protein AALO_G00122920 [Alosa alosa]|uniref:Rho GTPase-activating protein SYDE2 n=1 Tax=Alosa alosa TaxID=278164 RepID=A0AAV6GLG2_9TELE|nr:rho GTPase-activating protein SYDE2 isoform X1 [Alosa alosa]KAG5275639.1 hypothetical protein AALO_G00122920 [Alosa alosa]